MVQLPPHPPTPPPTTIHGQQLRQQGGPTTTKTPSSNHPKQPPCEHAAASAPLPPTHTTGLTAYEFAICALPMMSLLEGLGIVGFVVWWLVMRIVVWSWWSVRILRSGTMKVR